VKSGKEIERRRTRKGMEVWEGQETSP